MRLFRVEVFQLLVLEQLVVLINVVSIMFHHIFTNLLLKMQNNDPELYVYICLKLGNYSRLFLFSTLIFNQCSLVINIFFLNLFRVFKGHLQSHIFRSKRLLLV